MNKIFKILILIAFSVFAGTNISAGNTFKFSDWVEGSVSVNGTNYKILDLGISSGGGYAKFTNLKQAANSTDEIIGEFNNIRYLDETTNQIKQGSFKVYKNADDVVYLANGVDDLARFMSKSLSDKLAYIDNIWNTKYPIPDMLGGRSFLEDIMGQYRYTQSSGWIHTGDISFNFKGIDFYKGTETGSQIFANTAVSMKTTIQTDVNTWLNYTSIQDNIRFLRDGMSPTGMIDPNNLKTMFITDAKIHIYMPKANITPTLKTQWMNKLNADYPDIDFEIKAIEDFIN